MNSAAPTPPTADQHALLQRVLAVGAALLDKIEAQASAQAAADPAAPLSAPVRDFERVARTIRRTILLQQKLDQPVRTRTAGRRAVLRAVEDAIHRHADGDDTLHAELLDRLDRPELAEELDDGRPVAAIIADIIRDLGLAAIPGLNDPWQRRTPADIATLHARAAPPGPLAPSPPGLGQTRSPHLTHHPP